MRAVLDSNCIPAVRVRRNESRLGRWELASRRPHSKLRPYVLGYVGLKSALSLMRERHLPSGEAGLVVNLGAAYRVIDPINAERTSEHHSVSVMGVHDRYFVTENAGAKHLFVVRLTPAGAHALLGTPMVELINRCIELDAVSRSRDASRSG